MAKKLYVGNLDYEVTDDELTQVFNQCGQVSEAKVVKDKETGKSKGFGFVEMLNNDEATHAIDRMNGFDLKGRSLIVDEAKEPQQTRRTPSSESRQNNRPQKGFQRRRR